MAKLIKLELIHTTVKHGNGTKELPLYTESQLFTTDGLLVAYSNPKEGMQTTMNFQEYVESLID